MTLQFILLLFFMFFLFYIGSIVIGYPLFMLFIASLSQKKGKIKKEKVLPSISIIFPFCYEPLERFKNKLVNFDEIIYPRDKLEIIAISDKANSPLLQIAKHYEKIKKIKLLQLPRRRGRTFALKEGCRKAKNEIIIVTDADTLLHPYSLLHMVNLFDEETGAVSGVIEYVNKDLTLSTKTQNLYWQYEILIRKCEGYAKKLLTLTGAFYGVKKKYLCNLPSYIEDEALGLPLMIISEKKSVKFCSKAWAKEIIPESSKMLLKRRERITFGGISTVLNFLKNTSKFNFGLFLQICFHKFLRWFIPLVFLLEFVVSFILSFYFSLFLWVFIPQGLLLLISFITLIINKGLSFLSFSNYLIISLFAISKGIYKKIKGEKLSSWERTT